MKIFLSNRTIDKDKVKSIIKANKLASNGIEISDHLTIEDTEEKWKKEVKNKIRQANEILIFIGATSKDSTPMNWEFNEILSQKKSFGVIKIEDSYELPRYLKKYTNVIIKPDDLLYYLLSKEGLKTTPELLLDQYKIMISSTEKVTEQRLKVNNLFFTVTTTLLSFSLLIGKAFEFNNLAIGLMFVFSIMAFIITFFWEKLIKSYGKLNTGKFKVIDEIERKLETNLFQREWELLQNEVGYESNTVTESKIIKSFRLFIFVIGISELIYLTIQISKNCCYG